MAQVAAINVKLSLEERITAPLKRIKAQLLSLSENLKLDGITTSSKNLIETMKSVGDGFAKATGRIGKFGALVGQGGHSIVSFLLGFSGGLAKTALELEALSKRAGVSVETLQELFYAGKNFNITSDAMVDGLTEMNIRANEFVTTGKGGAADAFKTLGYSAKELKQGLTEPDKLFGDIIERLGKLDTLSQTRFSDELFGGNAGEQFLAMMGKSKNDIADLRQEARMSGNILGDDSVSAMINFISNLGSIVEKMTGFRDRIAKGLLPVVQDLVQMMKEWIDVNEEWINSNITGAIDWLKKVISDLKNPTSELRQFIDALKEGFLKLYQKIKPIIDFFGGPLVIALAALATYIAGPLVVSIVSLAEAFISLGTAMMTTPIGWIIAAIVGLIAIGYALYQSWDKISGYFSGIFERIRSAFDEGIIKGIMTLLYEFNPLKLFMDAIGGISQYLFGVDFTEPATSIIKSFLLGITDTFTSILEFFANISSQIWDAITSGGSFSEIGMNIIKIFWDGAKTAWDGVCKWLQNAISKLTNWMPDWMKEKLGLKIEGKATTTAIHNVKQNVDRTNGFVTNIKSESNISSRRAYKENVIDGEQTVDQDESQILASAQAKIQTMNIDDPIVAYEPANIDASVTIENLHIETTGAPEEIRRLVEGVMSEHAARQQRAIYSGLTD